MVKKTLEAVYEDLRIKEIEAEKMAFEIAQALKEPSEKQESIYISFNNEGTINKNSVVIGRLKLFFSYKTIVAFSNDTGFYCSENIWSRTTGKFLGELEADKNKRLPNDLFMFKLNQALRSIK